MVLERLELLADDSVYRIGVHDDGRYDVTSRSLTLDHLFIGAHEAAEILAPLMDDADVVMLADAGKRFSAVLEAIKAIRRLGKH